VYRRPLRPVAPSLGDAAGRPRNGPHSNGPELPPSQETGEFAAVRFTLLAPDNLQLPRERERRTK